MTIDELIYSLSYNPTALLAVTPDGNTTTQPDTTRVDNSSAVIITTKTQHKLSKSLSDVALLRPTSGVVFPGALILADGNLMDGQPTPIALKRAPLTISVDLPGLLPPAVVVDSPANSAVQDAVTRLVGAWQGETAGAGYINAARSYLQITNAYSSQQAALDLGFNAQWASGDASAQLKVSVDTETTTVMAYYKQVFYTVTVDTPAQPSAFFASSVTPGELSQVISNDHPPAYVRSVDYGRILMVKMTNSSGATSVDVKAAFQEASGEASGGGTVSGKYQDILKQSSFQVLALGGGAPTAAAFTGDQDVPARLKTYIEKDAVFRRDNPGIPISYNVAFMKDNELATMGFTTDYTETVSVRYPNGWIGLWQDGAYVAHFDVTWRQMNGNGSPVSKEWHSGDQTAGYVTKLNLPGDAASINITAKDWTGLAWSPQNEAMNTVINGPDNKWYRIYGTTLNPQWDNKPH